MKEQIIDTAEEQLVVEKPAAVEDQLEGDVSEALSESSDPARKTAQQIRRDDRLLKRDLNAIFYRLTQLEERVAPVERNVSSIEERLPPLEVSATLLEKRQQPIESLIRDFSRRIEAMEARLEQQTQQFDDQIGKLKEHTAFPIDWNAFISSRRR